jgi:hypothetical protein
MRRLCWVFVLSGCDDALFPEHGGEIEGEGWCAVGSMISGSCLACHSAGAALGGLDLETDPHGTLTTGASAAGTPYVVVDDPETSLLLRKLTGELDASEGGQMPPSGALDAAVIDAVGAWITEGADDVCEGGTDPTGTNRYHPTGWAEPAAHGLATKLGEQDCRTCHGAELEGGAAIACSSCHDAVVPGWTTSCTFCHGDRETGQHAPPQDIDDNDDPDTLSFPAHRAHVEDTDLHVAWDCAMCHAVPTSALTPGHLFDDATPGRAEVAFALAPAAGASYADGTCSDVYCHGDGQVPGDITVEVQDVVCGGCHPVGSRGAWDRLSGEHERHLDEGVTCDECHPTVQVTPEYAITDLPRHIDGAIAIELPATMSRRRAPPSMSIDASGCTGTCHGEIHTACNWRTGDDCTEDDL